MLISIYGFNILCHGAASKLLSYILFQKKAGNGSNQEKTEQVESLRLLVSEANFTQESICNTKLLEHVQ